MAKLVIIYHSHSGNTEKMAEEVAQGARAVKGVEVVSRRVEMATNEDLTSSSGIIIGSPTYFRQMAAELKSFIDKSIDIYGKLGGKIGGVFSSSGSREDGKKCLTSLYEALDCHGMKVIGKVLALEAPGEKEREECRRLGEKVAREILG